MEGGEFVHYVVDEYPVRLVGLDTTLADQHNGALCERRLDWLRARLEENSDEPTLVFMHHPPFASGTWWMDGIGLRDGLDGLRVLLDGHGQVRRIVCGHLHRAIQSEIGSTPVSVCPSTSYQVYLDTLPESPPRFIAEPPALQLHAWAGEAFVTHTAYVAFPAEPIDLVPIMSNWDERRERTRRGLSIRKSVAY
jgi:Icc protein